MVILCSLICIGSPWLMLNKRLVIEWLSDVRSFFLSHNTLIFWSLFSFLLFPPFLHYANYKVVATSTTQLEGLCVFLTAFSQSSNVMYPFGANFKP
jgi:hypothetical protein